MGGWESQVESFRRQGFTVLPSVLDSRQIEAFREAYRGLVKTAHHVRGDGEESPFVGNVMEQAPQLLDPVLSLGPLVPLLERIMGPFVQLDSSMMVSFPSQTPERRLATTAWHRDRHANFPTGAYSHPRTVITMTYLQDMNDDNGPLRVIPGSHVTPVAITPAEMRTAHGSEELLRTRAGDTVLVHTCTLHSGTANVAGAGNRMFLGMAFNMSYMRQSEPTDGPNCEALRNRYGRAGNHRMSRLLGSDAQVEARLNDGFWLPEADDWSRWIAEDQAALM